MITSATPLVPDSSTVLLQISAHGSSRLYNSWPYIIVCGAQHHHHTLFLSPQHNNNYHTHSQMSQSITQQNPIPNSQLPSPALSMRAPETWHSHTPLPPPHPPPRQSAKLRNAAYRPEKPCSIALIDNERVAPALHCWFHR